MIKLDGVIAYRFVGPLSGPWLRQVLPPEMAAAALKQTSPWLCQMGQAAPDAGESHDGHFDE